MPAEAGGGHDPQGHPACRLSLGVADLSLKRRLRNCVIGMRAEAYAYESAEYAALEVYLMDRAKGLNIESPGIRP